MTSDCASHEWLQGISLELMVPLDLGAVIRLERECFPSTWSPDSYLRELRNPNSYYIVARRDGEIVGFAGMWVIADESHVSTLAVSSRCRRRGLGELIMRHLIDIARARFAAKMTLEVREQNEAAQTLYRKLGFEIQGLLPHYYGDTGENAFVMKKELTPTDPDSDLD